MTTNVTDASFADEVLGSSVPVLVDFWAEWCPPCHRIAPMLEELSAEYAGRAKIVKLDADVNPQTVSAYGVMSMPTLTIFRGGERVAQVVGAQSRTKLKAMLDEAISA